MICSIDGQYFIRDMGFVHASRLKLDTKCEVQIHKGCLVDLGKVVHYHFDKAIHLKEPTPPDSSAFYVLRHKKSYEVDADDFPHLRARPTWVSAEEHIENIQNEINIYADGQKMINSLGRSMKRDIQIKLKAVSADHCAIAYNPERGWTISERGKDRASSNGTYVFLNTLKQMRDHMPSDLIPLHDGMIISFVNYELRVRFEEKTADEVRDQTRAASLFFSQLDEEMAAKSYPVAGRAPTAGATGVPEPVAATAALQGGDGYVAEQVQPSAEVAPIEPAAELEAPKEPEADAGGPPVAVKAAAPGEEAPGDGPAAEEPAQAEAEPAAEAKEEA
jgi:pSer/pThr/pTyr-binding forkhead associated (FHA) protein